MKRVHRSWSAIASACLVAACGGDPKTSTTVNTGSGSSSTLSTTLAGVASKGPLKAAKVTAYRVDSKGVRGAKITDGKTSAVDGSYSLNLGSYSGPVQLEMEVIPGETKSADEATGVDVELPADFKLRANVVVSALAGADAKVDVHITPFTELAHSLIEQKGGATAENIQAATALVSKTYGFDPVATRPIPFDDKAVSETATEAQKRYAMYNAAVSSWAQLSDGGCSGKGGNGAKLQCAVDELKKTLEVAAASSATESAVQVKGTQVAVLGKAMVNAAKLSGNQTGIGETHKLLADVNLLATEPPKITIAKGQTGDDASAKARKFFDNLRSNAAALESGSVDQGLRTALDGFAQTIENDAATVTAQVGRAVTVADFARQLWDDYTTAGGPNGSARGRDQCFVMKGSFPGGLSDAVVQADDPANATWVSCNLPFESSAQRMTIRFNFKGASSLAAVPYTAGSRVVTGQTSAWKPSAASQWSGTVGFTLNSGGDLTGVSFVGNLPPALDFNGSPLATRYAVNLSAAVSRSNTHDRVLFSAGSLGVVPLNASVVSTSVDVAPAAGPTEIVQWLDPNNLAQVKSSKLVLAGQISNAKGELNGRLSVDQFEKAFGADDERAPRARYSFTGDLSLAGKGKILSGSLTIKPVSEGSQFGVLNFEGALALPSRPQAKLSLIATETSQEKATLSGTYEQNGLTVRFTVSDQDVAEFEGVEAGVSMTIRDDGKPIEVKVNGGKAATIHEDKNRIDYVDGSFESLI
jgi:hypothetical protein